MTKQAGGIVVMSHNFTGRRLRPPPPPVEVKLIARFVYAIQHVPSGVCLFLARAQPSQR